MSKHVKITVETDGGQVFRNYAYETDVFEINWNRVVTEMVATIEDSWKPIA